MEEVLNYIKNNTSLNPNDYVVIGLSGGPDSMTLLDILIKYSKIVNYKIVCAHVHHSIRKESDEEALFVEKYCKKNNIIFEMTKLEYEGKFTESLGHKMRYEFFDSIVVKYNAKYLFTAHHGDDLIETILMRIVRGSNLSGYAGFESIIRNDKYTVVRPLIYVTKEDILSYLKRENIPYVIDLSNEDTSYTRNRYRKYILPKLKAEDTDVHLKFVEFSNLLREYDEYIRFKVDSIYDNIVVDNVINLLLLMEQDKLIIRNIIYKWLSNIYCNSINLVSKKHVESIINVIYSSRPNIVIDIPNYKVIKEYNKLSINKMVNIENYEYIISKEIVLPNGRKIIEVSNSSLSNNFVTYINSADVSLPLYVRNYRQGDKMTIKNMVGHKKIKDIFINEKVNIQERTSYPIVTDSNGEIIWLPGIKKSAFDNKKNGKYDIILEYH